MNRDKVITKIPPFLEGWATIYDLNPTINNPYLNENGKMKSSEQLLHEYWSEVGNYLQDAMTSFDNEQKQKVINQQ